jgi:hypothetical protein
MRDRGSWIEDHPQSTIRNFQSLPSTFASLGAIGAFAVNPHALKKPKNSLAEMQRGR